ncbi:signal peptidase I [Streptomyces sp. MUM 203J]|uniref:signal peptidase I n=1 Tax=Streptomyces sp. MUM 203J TaxID=2791990 RepID=UPI001F03B94D|nr:signal peptidase I [Streptomyces sp. MUM 203J]MCH0541240.1 signal peptidase I [Streptomyces sp. MUM 203J]
MGGTTGSGGDGHGRLGRMLSGLAVAVGCVLFLGGFAWAALVYHPYTVPTDSMSPTVTAGDRVLAERVGGADVRRGDIVVFSDPRWGGVTMIKRVVGVDGDEVVCCDADGRLTVNGTAVDEPYLHPQVWEDAKAASPGAFSATVPDGHLFLLGDQRASSQDSRVHLTEPGQGSVPRSAVTGRLDAVVWPLEGVLERPAAFASLPGGVSRPGPVEPLAWALAAGVGLILGGAAYGPVAGVLRRAVGRGGSGGAGGRGAGSGEAVARG